MIIFKRATAPSPENAIAQVLDGEAEIGINVNWYHLNRQFHHYACQHTPFPFSNRSLKYF